MGRATGSLAHSIPYARDPLSPTPSRASARRMSTTPRVSHGTRSVKKSFGTRNNKVKQAIDGSAPGSTRVLLTGTHEIPSTPTESRASERRMSTTLRLPHGTRSFEKLSFGTGTNEVKETIDASAPGSSPHPRVRKRSLQLQLEAFERQMLTTLRVSPATRKMDTAFRTKTTQNKVALQPRHPPAAHRSTHTPITILPAATRLPPSLPAQHNKLFLSAKLNPLTSDPTPSPEFRIACDLCMCGCSESLTPPAF
jgi:hypothetical protein